MKQKIIKQVNYWLGVTAIGLVLGLSLQFARAWTEPAAAPPGGNVGAPINTGNVYQSKSAGLEINENLDLQGSGGEWRILTIDRGTGDQQIIGDGNSALYFDSNNDIQTQMIFRDKQNKFYGRVFGNGDGANFGLLDGDGHWSYLAAKDNYTQFRINNSAKMTIRNNGNVGIGTTGPGYKLDINTDNAAPLRVTGDSSVVWNRASIYSQDTAAGGRRFAFGSRAGTFSISDETASRRRFTINSEGNVGIGTTSPSEKLTVNGGISLSGGNVYYINGIKGLNSGGAPVHIHGSVGIGTTTPTQKLDVDGVIRTSPRSSATCNASAEGGIYYDSDDNHFYGCNGSSWVQLDSSGAVYQ